MSIHSVFVEIAVTSLLSIFGPEPGELPELQPPGTEENCAGDASLRFVAPVDGAMLDSPITVSYVVGQACNCDTGGCYDTDLDSPQLSANGEFYNLTGPPIEVHLPAGEHTLTLTGEADFHSESVSITVTILEGSEGSGGSESGSGSGSGSGSSCAVVQPSERAATTFGLLLLLGLGARRARRCR